MFSHFPAFLMALIVNNLFGYYHGLLVNRWRSVLRGVREAGGVGRGRRALISFFAWVLAAGVGDWCLEGGLGAVLYLHPILRCSFHFLIP